MNILIIGGNRFFGKKLTRNLVSAGHEVTLLNRGNVEDGFGNAIERIRCDRRNLESLKTVLANKKWDVVYDQVCFDAHEAQSALEVFKGKTGHYIFTSSQSVYSPGQNLKEEIFDPRNYFFKETVEMSENYAEAKRQCEAVFFGAKDLPVTAVRFPIVLGRDDYTKRLHFHIERVRSEKPIYFPNIDAQISFICSDDAASALEYLATVGPLGPINAASMEPIVLSDLMAEIAAVVGKKAVLAKKDEEKNHSPYGIESSWFMDVTKLSSLGYEARPIQAWLRDEIVAIQQHSLSK